MSQTSFSVGAAALLLLASASSSNAALVIGDTITTTFLSGGWSLALTLNPASSLTIGAGPEATFTGTHNYPFGAGTATYVIDLFNDNTGRSFLDLTATFSSSPASAPSIGSNFNFGSLDFGPGFQLGSVLPVTGTTFASAITANSFSISTGGVIISTTPQTLRVELVAVPVPEPTVGLSVGVLGSCLLGRRRRR